jgi:hypothetical protein
MWRRVRFVRCLAKSLGIVLGLSSLQGLSEAVLSLFPPRTRRARRAGSEEEEGEEGEEGEEEEGPRRTWRWGKGR